MQWGLRRRGLAVLITGWVVLGGEAAAANLDDPLEQWLPSATGSSWIYEWSDSQYATTPTRERYTVAAAERTSFRLSWTTEGLDNPEGAVRSIGQVDYRRTESGLVNVDWASSPPPSHFPILCPSASNCANSLASTHYQLIWGSRSPVLAEPLVRGLRWNSLGGAGNDVASTNRYAGRERVRVPAFPAGVEAAKVESEITQAGALGDPYGSGSRTVWWVRGVGPVKVLFRHAGGQTTRAELTQTTLRPRRAPSDLNLLPLDTGAKARYRLRNTRHLRRASVQEVAVRQVVNGTAQLEVRDISGPIRVRGSYILSSRLSGVTLLSGFTRAATRTPLPKLARGRHLRTPIDFMAYGFNPVLPAHARRGDRWRGVRTSRDYRVFGALGTARVVGTARVRTPAGTFTAVGVESRLTQRGSRFGTGRRTSWFAPGVGLVKVVFRHRDGSVSTVERLR